MKIKYIDFCPDCGQLVDTLFDSRFSGARIQTCNCLTMFTPTQTHETESSLTPNKNCIIEEIYEEDKLELLPREIEIITEIKDLCGRLEKKKVINSDYLVDYSESELYLKFTRDYGLDEGGLVEFSLRRCLLNPTGWTRATELEEHIKLVSGLESLKRVAQGLLDRHSDYTDVMHMYLYSLGNQEKMFGTSTFKF